VFRPVFAIFGVCTYLEGIKSFAVQRASDCMPETLKYARWTYYELLIYFAFVCLICLWCWARCLCCILQANLEIYVPLYAYVTMQSVMLTSLQHFWAQCKDIFGSLHPHSPNWKCWYRKLPICIRYIFGDRSQWPRGLRRRSVAAGLRGLRFRVPPWAWVFVCCECYVLSLRRVDPSSRGVPPSVRESLSVMVGN
jgi:hypothetical protein